ncbi:MAG: DUF4465 domain-containing protein [Planctomycetia bacterium]
MQWKAATTMVTVIALRCAAIAAPANAVVIDFEDVPLSPNSATYGGPGTLPDYEPEQVLLTSGSASFRTTITRYSPDEWWSGFAFSNKGDNTTNSWMNDTSSFTGSGAGGSGNFAVANLQSYDPPPLIVLPAGMRPVSVKLVNTTYTALTIRDGDPNNFSDGKYGADDFLSVTFTGNSLADGTGSITGTATLFLADFREGAAIIVDTWTELSLATLGEARSIVIGFDSSDVGINGINTPMYVAMDDLTVIAVPEPSAVVLLACGVVAGLGTRRMRRR